jgi:hypothetical protein
VNAGQESELQTKKPVRRHCERSEAIHQPTCQTPALEPFPIRLNRIGALVFCFYAFSSREPASTSLENALTSLGARQRGLALDHSQGGLLRCARNDGIEGLARREILTR